MIVIADTSPINYLVRINEIDLLPALFGRIIVPPLRLRGAERESRAGGGATLDSRPAGLA